ncbi:hypothetical protein V2J09_007402 [Rumex salicifolius]
MEKLKNGFKNFFYSAGNVTIFAVLILVGLLISFYAPNKHSVFFCSKPNDTPIAAGAEAGLEDLTAVLEKASEGNNKTVIVAVVNKAYVESIDGDNPVVNMMDLFLEGFWQGEETRPLIKHLVIVATDPTAYERCVFRGIPNCYLLANHTDGADLAGENVYMSKGFIDMMWRRTFFLLTVLRKGYSFIFTDTDVMWLRNPFTRLSTIETNDMQFSTDRFNGDPKSERNPINTGFYHVRSNNRTISLYERWFSMHDKSPGMKEQDVMQKLINDGALRELNLSTTFLETRYFSGFCQDSREPDRVVTVHANCCRYIASKVKDLSSVLNDWKRLKKMESVNDTKAYFAWSPHLGCQDSWRH